MKKLKPITLAQAKESLLLKRRDVASLANVSPRTVARWTDKNILPQPKEINGMLFYPAPETLAALEVK